MALAKRTIAEADLNAGRLKVLFDEKDAPLSFGYYLVWPQTRDPSPAQLRFMEWLRSEAAKAEPIAGGPGERPVFAAQDI